MEGETMVYGSGTGEEENHQVMSERVQALAASIYKEFERMIQKYDEDVVKELMPLVVGVLETLDGCIGENRDTEVELELLKDDNEQLVTQYEREKQLRKSAEQKFLEMEDRVEEQSNEQQSKTESLESIVRLLELKARNASDHVHRLEEKEDNMKKEYTKLHDRYTELFKTHMDYMERTKILMGTDRIETFQLAGKQRQTSHVTRPRATPDEEFNINEQHDVICREDNVPCPQVISTLSPLDSSGRSLRTELGNKQDQNFNREALEQQQLHREKVAEIIATTPELEQAAPFGSSSNVPTPTRSEYVSIPGRHLNTRSIEAELSFDDLAKVDDGADITGSAVNPGDYASSVESNTDQHLEDGLNGMGKEIENLILENNELLATKNALNVVKDDLIARVDELSGEHEILRGEIESLQTIRTKLMHRVGELEEELRRLREEHEKNAQANKQDDESEVPMAQRKRFTRVEMARVLMERNQYKERLMELQEAVRWTEMIRASKMDPGADKKQKSSTIWKFFGSLFSTQERPAKKSLPAATVGFNSPTLKVHPHVDAMQTIKLKDKHRAFDFLDTDLMSERSQAMRQKERREQYKQVRAHVKKDDGRMQAYGWSLPAKGGGGGDADGDSRNVAKTPVPVPVYCRPLMHDNDPAMKIWCAAGANLSGGLTKDGGAIVGDSVFYTQRSTSPFPPQPADCSNEADGSMTSIDKLDKQITQDENDKRRLLEEERSLSSFVWICTSTHSSSKVSVIDANKPGDMLDSFNVCSSHLLCIASVPGAKVSDYPSDGENSPSCVVSDEKSGDGEESDGSVGRVIAVTVGEEDTTASPAHANQQADTLGELNCKLGSIQQAEEALTGIEIQPDVVTEDEKRKRAEIEQVESKTETSGGSSSSVLPTMWMGSQTGSVYVYSAVEKQWRQCLHTVRLKDSVLSIVHVKGRVLASQADGCVAVFHRDSDGRWDMKNYYLLDLGTPHHSVRCLTVVYDQVWCGYRNHIHIINPKTLALQQSLDAHPRKESQVRQMMWIGDGVWVTIRLDSTLRLYHAHTYQHLQDVDIEPYVSKMLGTGKLGFSFVRITALLVSCNRLWIGTGNGVVISVPLSEENKQMSVGGGGRAKPGGVIRVYANDKDGRVMPGTFLPYCNMAHAQLSFHGHKDSVKFFVSVPDKSIGGGLSGVQVETGGKRQNGNMLVISGGEGYIDFRIGDGEEEGEEMSVTSEGTEATDPQQSLSRGDRTHLIVWQVTPTSAS